MAKLLQLSPEILLQIATSSRSTMSARSRLARLSPSHKLFRDAIRAGNLPILYLILTCKHLASVLTSELYRFVAIKSAQRLYSFLRLLWIRPKLVVCVKQLYLQLSPLNDGVPSFGHEQMRFLQSWAKPMGIDLEDAVVEFPVSRLETDFDIELPMILHDEKCLAAATAMLLHRLNKLQEVTISLNDSTLSCISEFLGHDLAVVRQRPEGAQRPSGILPKLKSLTLSNEFGYRTSTEVWRGDSVLCVASLSASLTELQVVEGHFIDIDSELYGLVATVPKLNSLILRKVFISRTCLGQLLNALPNLSSFTLQLSSHGSGSDVSQAATPRSVIEELKCHYERLRKLCLELDLFDEYSCPEDEWVTTFKDFANLEDLTIDAWSLDDTCHDVDEVQVDNSNETGDDDGQQTAKIPAFRALPTSLKRLHIKGNSSNISQSMNWLMMNLNDSLPHLEELKFLGVISVSPQATEAVEDLGVKLRY